MHGAPRGCRNNVRPRERPCAGAPTRQKAEEGTLEAPRGHKRQTVAKSHRTLLGSRVLAQCWHKPDGRTAQVFCLPCVLSQHGVSAQFGNADHRNQCLSVVPKVFVPIPRASMRVCTRTTHRLVLEFREAEDEHETRAQTQVPARHHLGRNRHCDCGFNMAETKDYKRVLRGHTNLEHAQVLLDESTTHDFHNDALSARAAHAESRNRTS